MGIWIILLILSPVITVAFCWGVGRAFGKPYSLPDAPEMWERCDPEVRVTITAITSLSERKAIGQ